MEELLSVKEIAFKYRVSQQTIYGRVRGFYWKKGRKIYYTERFPCPVNKVGGKFRFKSREVEFFFNGESEDYQRTMTRAKIHTNGILDEN